MAEPLARAEFEPTVDERVEMEWRFYRHSPAARRDGRRMVTVTALLVTLFVPLAILAMASTTTPTYIAVATAIAALSAGVAMHFAWPIRARQLLRSSVGDAIGDDAERCVIELHDDGVRATAGHNVSHLSWQDIDSITDDDGDIVMLSARGGVGVRRRAFATDDEQRAFLELARRLAELR